MNDGRQASIEVNSSFLKLAAFQSQNPRDFNSF